MAFFLLIEYEYGFGSFWEIGQVVDKQELLQFESWEKRISMSLLECFR